MKLSLALLIALQTADRVPITIEEYLQLRDLDAVAVAPAGRAVAFTVTRTDLAGNEYRTELFLKPEPGGEPRVVTANRTKVGMPRWSPDGDWLAFTSPGSSGDSASDAARQIWLLPVRSRGEAIQLTHLPGGVLDFGWGPEGVIYALTTERPPAVLRAIRERERRRGDDPIIVQDRAELRREIWSVRVPDGDATYVWGGDRGVDEMAVSPNGELIAYTTNYSGAVGDYDRFDLWILDVAGGSVRQLTDRAGAERAPVWSPDGSQIVIQAPQNPELSYSQTELFRVNIESGALQNLTDSFDRAVLDHRWPAGGDLLFRAAMGAYTHLFALRTNGAVEHLTAGQLNYGPFDATADGAIYAVRESATEGEELWRIRGHGDDRLTRLNRRTDGWSIARQEIITWTAPDGLAVEGLLVYPIDYSEDRRYPMLVNPHGGPSSRVRDVLDQFHMYQAFAAQGYAVLAPNFRGSVGYGEAFGTANRQDLGGGDFQDLMSGIDRVIEMGVADSTRIGIYGGSYGGYMTNWAITQSSRFRAAVSMYGIFSLITDYSNSNIPRWEHDYLGSYYWEDLEAHLDRSPMRHVEAVETPVLIIHGAEDPNTFVANSNEMYRALNDLGRTVEFVKYPREGHGIREPRHRLDLFFRQLRWFDRYLRFGGADLFEFYLVDEWVPGPGGWQMRVVSAEPRSAYTGMTPPDGRYLEVTLVLRPDTGAVDTDAVERLVIDLEGDLRLTGPTLGPMAPAGTVIELFDQKTLVTGALGTIQVNPPERGRPTALAVAVAFEVPDEAAEYRLQATGFAPVRIWLGPEGDARPMPDDRAEPSPSSTRRRRP